MPGEILIEGPHGVRLLLLSTLEGFPQTTALIQQRDGPTDGLIMPIYTLFGA